MKPFFPIFSLGDEQPTSALDSGIEVSIAQIHSDSKSSLQSEKKLESTCQKGIEVY